MLNVLYKERMGVVIRRYRRVPTRKSMDLVRSGLYSNVRVVARMVKSIFFKLYRYVSI